jgi:hypothetical protein
MVKIVTPVKISVDLGNLLLLDLRFTDILLLRWEVYATMQKEVGVSVKGICRLNFGKRGDLGGGILVERLS